MIGRDGTVDKNTGKTKKYVINLFTDLSFIYFFQCVGETKSLKKVIKLVEAFLEQDFSGINSIISSCCLVLCTFIQSWCFNVASNILSAVNSVCWLCSAEVGPF